MKSTPPPQPRKRPKQSRSLLLVAAIQEACLKILDQEGPDELTTGRIADVAGINIASLYQYFPNKDAILAEVFEERVRYNAEVAAQRFTEIEKLSQESLEETLRAIIDMEVEQQLQLIQMDPEFYRTYQHSFDVHRRVNELTVSRDNPSWEAWFPRFLNYHREELRSHDLVLLSRMARQALEGMLLTASPGQMKPGEHDAFKEELLILLLNYLRR